MHLNKNRISIRNIISDTIGVVSIFAMFIVALWIANDPDMITNAIKSQMSPTYFQK